MAANRVQAPFRLRWKWFQTRHGVMHYHVEVWGMRYHFTLNGDNERAFCQRFYQNVPLDKYARPASYL